MKPIHKQGEVNELDSYRPNALLSTNAQVFEKPYEEKTMFYVKKYKLVNTNKFQFRMKHKTVATIASVIQEIKSYLDEQILSCCVFFDLKKRFDTVNHAIFFHRSEKSGFR